MTVGHRHKVVVGPIPDQRLRTDPGRVLVAGIVGGCWKGKQGHQVSLESLSYRLVMTSQPGIKPLVAVVCHWFSGAVRIIPSWLGGDRRQMRWRRIGPMLKPGRSCNACGSGGSRSQFLGCRR